MTTTTNHDLGIAAGLLHQNRGTPTVAPDTPVWSGNVTWTNTQSAGAVSGSNVTVWDFVADNLDLGAAGTVSASVSWSTVAWPDAQQLLIAFKPGPTTFPVTVAAQVTTAAAAGRHIPRACAVPLATAASARRRISHTLRRTVATAASVTATSHGPLRNAVVRIGAAADRWIIGPAQRRWKIGPGQ
jgi:hypothetical protein